MTRTHLIACAGAMALSVVSSTGCPCPAIYYPDHITLEFSEPLTTSGTLVLKTTIAQPWTLDLSPVVVNEIRLVGSRCGHIARAVEVLASGTVDPLPLISARYHLSEAVQAFERASQPGELKVLVSNIKG